MTDNQAYFPPERPEIDVCLQCGFEGWHCVCAAQAQRKPTPAELRQARESRLTRAERGE